MEKEYVFVFVHPEDKKAVTQLPGNKNLDPRIKWKIQKYLKISAVLIKKWLAST